jgi:hypothetical protein
VWEYPISGVPVLATNLVEIEKIVTQWGIGRLLPRAFNENDILAALNQTDDKTLKTWQKNCDVCNKEMSWNRFEDALLSCY